MLLVVFGGLGEKKESRGFNRATQAIRQTGSAGKPISVILPAIDKKIVTASTILNDSFTKFDDGTEEGYSPTDYNKSLGDITLRRAVESSQNIPFVQIMEKLTPKASIKYMKKLGITTLTKEDENLNLALGGLQKGISPIEMCSAYASIANDGVYISPTFYIKIENQNGNTILKSKPKSKRVFSKQVAFIMKSLLMQPVKGINGTATYCKINNTDVCAKTGTTDENYDRWLCGFTPYYTAVTWFGYDINETINFNGQNPAGLIWSNVMKQIHSDLKSNTFEKPSYGITEVKICADTGLISNDTCKSTYIEYYLKGTEPTEHCK